MSHQHRPLRLQLSPSQSSHEVLRFLLPRQKSRQRQHPTEAVGQQTLNHHGLPGKPGIVATASLLLSAALDAMRLGDGQSLTWKTTPR